jgi:ATP-dependent exoDNAse (exonuclease V) beta subunit
MAPGRLFIVGDPKQSIYWFRGADIETYGEITDAAAVSRSNLERLELTTNFRSVPSILGFVDAAFRDAMKKAADRPYQPEYLSFGGQGQLDLPPENIPSLFRLVNLAGQDWCGSNRYRIIIRRAAQRGWFVSDQRKFAGVQLGRGW